MGTRTIADTAYGYWRIKARDIEIIDISEVSILADFSSSTAVRRQLISKRWRT